MKRSVVAAGVIAIVLLAAGLRALARSRTLQLFTMPVSRVKTSDSVVALTFDDGPTSVPRMTVAAVAQRLGGIKVLKTPIRSELGDRAH